MTQVLQVDEKGPCWGHVRKGDSITHVNDTSFIGRKSEELSPYIESLKRESQAVMLRVRRKGFIEGEAESSLAFLLFRPGGFY